MRFGASVDRQGGVRFALWAPAADAVDLVIEAPGEARRIPLGPQGEGWFGVRVAGAAAGTRYRFAIDGKISVPDPASRFQPDDVHGASEVVDPAAFDWADGDWLGLPWEHAVLYELHVGAFTPQGTFRAVIDRLDDLAELGVTAIELMPVADWPGARNWGYDGAYPFAPDRRYGRPEDLKALVVAAHARGLMVLLDVVYNHFGPEGNYLHLYAPSFFTDRYQTPWGAAVNFDGDGSRTVRDFFVDNAVYWLDEFHLDGLRLDAVHAVCDRSHPHFLIELAERVRARTPPGRHVHLVLENDGNDSQLLRRAADFRPTLYTAQWNDDMHHALHVALTFETSGYYRDYAERPAAQVATALAEGFVYQGAPSPYRGGEPRGTPSGDLPPGAFVSFLQNHDQIGNRAFGERITELAPAPAVRAGLAIILLAPSPPLLFMGEEWGSTRRFPFFCDFGPDLAAAVRDGRRGEFARFPEFRDATARARIPDPCDPATFAAAILDWDARETSAGATWLAFTRRLLALRHRALVSRLIGMAGGSGQVVNGDGGSFSARWRLGDASVLTCVANLSATAAPALPRPPGQLLFSTHEAGAGDVLPSWAVRWFLAEAAP